MTEGPNNQILNEKRNILIETEHVGKISKTYFEIFMLANIQI